MMLIVVLKNKSITSQGRVAGVSPAILTFTKAAGISEVCKAFWRKSKLRQVRKKTWIVTILAICLMLLTGTQITVYAAGNHHTEGYFEYSISGDSVTIESYFGSESEVVIPDHIAALPVTKIENAAFADAGTVTKITIPDTVTEIGDNVFDDMKQLKEVVVQSVGLKVQVPSGCTVTEDYPVYVNPDGDSSANNQNTTDKNQNKDNNSEAGSGNNSSDNDSGNSSNSGNNDTGNSGGNNNDSAGVGFEAVAENSDAAQDRPGIKTSDNKLITVDDTNNLIEIDENGDIKVIDRDHKYSISTDDSGETVIKDNDGTQVNLDKDGITLTYTDKDGNAVTREDEKPDEQKSSMIGIIIVVVVVVILVAIGGVFLWQKKKKQKYA